MNTIEIILNYLIEHKNDKIETGQDTQEHFNNIHNLIKYHDLFVKENLTESNIKLFHDIKESSKEITRAQHYQKYNHVGYVHKDRKSVV